MTVAGPGAVTETQRRVLEAMADERLFVWLVMKPETRAALQAAADEYALTPGAGGPGKDGGG